MPSGLLQMVCPCPNGLKHAQGWSFHLPLSAADTALRVGGHVQQKTLATHLSSDL